MRIERADVCVIGSGAGGAVVAWEAASRGRSTIIVERGPYVRAAQMTHREWEMMPSLYKDGGLQMNASMDMFILQGSCVGGSTVLSNMVLMRPPGAVLDRWRALGAAIDRVALERTFAAVERRLDARPQSPSNVSTGAHLFLDAARSRGHDAGWMTKALGDCRGCGSCNLGCPFDTKRSALTTYVRWAEEAGARVLAETEVVGLARRGRRVVAVEALGGRTREPVRIVCRQVVVAAGAIGSSALLLRAGVRGRNVGTRVSFNAGAMVTAELDRPLDGFDADQMAVYLHGDGFVIEATHNPLMSAALTTPGWMAEHGALMKRWRNLTYAGPLVATEATGRVVHSPFFGREETHYRATAADLAKLRRGIRTIAEVFFAAGARHVYLPTRRAVRLDGPGDLAAIDRAVREAGELGWGSAHPQGGNPLSDDPAVGAVDGDFAVHGHENLFVCDASVFPTSIGVNPILTIMALAHHAAPRILARD